jgi:hypothetical protein
MTEPVTFAALVLGLLTSSVKTRYDSPTDNLRKYRAEADPT